MISTSIFLTSCAYISSSSFHTSDLSDARTKGTNSIRDHGLPIRTYHVSLALCARYDSSRQLLSASQCCEVTLARSEKVNQETGAHFEKNPSICWSDFPRQQ
jgi:hypothetical protein